METFSVNHVLTFLRRLIVVAGCFTQEEHCWEILSSVVVFIDEYSHETLNRPEAHCWQRHMCAALSLRHLPLKERTNSSLNLQLLFECEKGASSGGGLGGVTASPQPPSTISLSAVCRPVDLPPTFFLKICQLAATHMRAQGRYVIVSTLLVSQFSRWPLTLEGQEDATVTRSKVTWSPLQTVRSNTIAPCFLSSYAPFRSCGLLKSCSVVLLFACEKTSECQETVSCC